VAGRSGRIRSVSWQFKGKTPAWAYFIAIVLLGHIILQLATVYWISSRAPMQPDRTHSYQVRFGGGPAYFVQPWLGAYSDYGLYAGFALLGLFALLLWLNREKLERTR